MFPFVFLAVTLFSLRTRGLETIALSFGAQWAWRIAASESDKGLDAAAGTTQASSFSSASAPGLDEAGFWPVTSLLSVMTNGTQFAAFS